MSEKKAKKERKEPKVLIEFTIKVLDNGDIALSGPVDNIMGFMDATNRAGRMVLDHALKNMQKAAQSKIIVPKFNTSGIKLH